MNLSYCKSSIKPPRSILETKMVSVLLKELEYKVDKLKHKKF